MGVIYADNFRRMAFFVENSFESGGIINRNEALDISQTQYVLLWDELEGGEVNLVGSLDDCFGG